MTVPVRTRLLRPLLAGLAGTTVMTATTKLEAVLRGEPGQPVDYDDSRIPVQLVERVSGHRFADDETEQFVNEIIHFGYGSAAGLVRAAVARSRRPALTFFALTWGLEVVALPVLGLAPPVWRWRRDVMVTSMVQHAIFTAVTDAVFRAISPPPPSTIPTEPDETAEPARGEPAGSARS